MAEKWVRCVRCHYVFDAEEGPCIKCGTPYKEPPAPTPAPEGTYSEIFAAEIPPTQSELVAAPPRRRENTTYLIYGGIALMAVAVVVALLFSLGLSGGLGATPAPLHAVLPAGSVSRTLPPTVSQTIAQLNDTNFNARVSVQARIQMTTAVAAKAQIIVISYDGVVSGGNQWGTLKVNAGVQEAMLVDGVIFVRTPPATTWTAGGTFPSYKVISPLFGLKDANALTMVGQDTSPGGRVLSHLQGTHWWTPDISRLAMFDLTTLRLMPDVQTLDLWTKPDGTPDHATFSAKTLAGNTSLFQMDVTYTFTDVGLVQPLAPPGPKWTESPGLPSSGPTASAAPPPTPR
jgi:hypothetical protein